MVVSPYTLEFIDPFNEPSPAVRQLQSGKIVVALASADAFDPDRQTQLYACLSDEEKARLSRFRFEPDARLFLVAHALLRTSLSRYAAVNPSAWQFCTGPYGRPKIAAPEPKYRVSLSYSHGIAVCAIALDHDVGIDVERCDNQFSLEEGERFLAPSELDHLRQTPPEHRAGLWFEYWTLKEAYAKARGLGLSLPFDRLSFHKQPTGHWQIAFGPLVEDLPNQWQFWSWKICGVYQAALATRFL